MFTPGVSTGTMNIEARRWRGASGSVTAMTIRKSARDALELNHLCPLMTYSSPSRTARVWISRRVRPGDAGLGHRERRAQLAGEQRVAVVALLLRRAGDRDDLAVAGVRRLVAEHRRRDRRRAEDLVHQRELDLAEALAAELGRQVRGPQPALLDLLLQRPEDRVEIVVARGRRRSSPAATARSRRTRASSRGALGTRARSRSPRPRLEASRGPPRAHYRAAANDAPRRLAAAALGPRARARLPTRRGFLDRQGWRSSPARAAASAPTSPACWRAEGARVVCCARTAHDGEHPLEGSLDGTVAAIRAAGGEAIAVAGEPRPRRGLRARRRGGARGLRARRRPDQQRRGRLLRADRGPAGLALDWCRGASPCTPPSCSASSCCRG